MNTCGNCKHWAKLLQLCHVYDATNDPILTLADMSCPRHELKIEYPDWKPVFHPGSETPKFYDETDNVSVNVLGFFVSEHGTVIVYRNGERWMDFGTMDDTETPDFWTYLPEGWE